MKNTNLALFAAFLLVCPLLVSCQEGEEAAERSKGNHPVKNVLERKLVIDKAHAKLILRENQNYAADTAKRNFKGDTLAYVTPWNNHGYDLAKIFNNKFTYVSPVWFQVKIDKLKLGGLHDIDKGWIDEVRGKSVTKIVPRFLFENARDPEDIFTHTEQVKKLLVDVCLEHNFDGIVVEGLGAMLSSRNTGDEGRKFLKSVADALHKLNKVIILVIPPQERSFNADDFAVYSEFVDKFSLMTYDHSTVEKPGPTSPLEWISQRASALSAGDRAHKVMLGLNFYGYDYIPAAKTGNAIVGETYLQLLKQYNPKITWVPSDAEHYFTYDDKARSHLVYYPTLKSVYDRIKLAEKLGMSIAIWEIGQGLDYFYDLL